MINPTNTTAFDAQIAWAHMQSAEIVSAQECGLDLNALWHVATVVGMIALAAFGAFLVIEWPILIIPVAALIITHIAINVLECIKNCCTTRTP